MADFLQGIAQLQARTQEIIEAKNQGAREGMGLALFNVLGVSNEQVPHEEGNLERDGAWSIADGELRGAVSYGRDADTAGYAEDQHENMTYTHDAGRNAKYLENAFNSTRAESAEIIAAQIRMRMGTE